MNSLNTSPPCHHSKEVVLSSTDSAWVLDVCGRHPGAHLQPPVGSDRPICNGGSTVLESYIMVWEPHRHTDPDKPLSSHTQTHTKGAPLFFFFFFVQITNRPSSGNACTKTSSAIFLLSHIVADVWTRWSPFWHSRSAAFWCSLFDFKHIPHTSRRVWSHRITPNALLKSLGSLGQAHQWFSTPPGIN